MSVNEPAVPTETALEASANLQPNTSASGSGQQVGSTNPADWTMTSVLNEATGQVDFEVRYNTDQSGTRPSHSPRLYITFGDGFNPGNSISTQVNNTGLTVGPTTYQLIQNTGTSIPGAYAFND